MRGSSRSLQRPAGKSCNKSLALYSSGLLDSPKTNLPMTRPSAIKPLSVVNWQTFELMLFSRTAWKEWGASGLVICLNYTKALTSGKVERQRFELCPFFSSSGVKQCCVQTHTSSLPRITIWNSQCGNLPSASVKITRYSTEDWVLNP